MALRAEALQVRVCAGLPRLYACLGFLGLAGMLVVFLLATPLQAFAVPAPGATAALEPVMTPTDPPSSKREPAKGKFLIAAERLRDSNFARSVVLLIEYGEGGALGLIINRASTHDLAEMFPSMSGYKGVKKHKVYFGGPVEPGQMLFLVRSAVKSMLFPLQRHTLTDPLGECLVQVSRVVSLNSDSRHANHCKGHDT